MEEKVYSLLSLLTESSIALIIPVPCFFLSQDNFLSVDEIVGHHDVFAGSRVTRYGDLLKDEF